MKPGMHVWRWRALTVWVVAFSALVALVLNNQHHATQRAQRAATETKTQNAKQQRVLVNLCNRGYVTLAVIDVMVSALPRYHNDLSVYRNVLVSELTDKDSPCVNATR